MDTIWSFILVRFIKTPKNKNLQFQFCFDQYKLTSVNRKRDDLVDEAGSCGRGAVRVLGVHWGCHGTGACHQDTWYRQAWVTVMGTVGRELEFSTFPNSPGYASLSLPVTRGRDVMSAEVRQSSFSSHLLINSVTLSLSPSLSLFSPTDARLWPVSRLFINHIFVSPSSFHTFCSCLICVFLLAHSLSDTRPVRPLVPWAISGEAGTLNKWLTPAFIDVALIRYNLSTSRTGSPSLPLSSLRLHCSRS